MYDKFFSLLTAQIPGEVVALVLTTAFTAVGAVGAGVYDQRKINKALVENDDGIEEANVVYTTYQRQSGGRFKQRLRTFDGDFNLKKIFNQKTQKRYFEYLSKAAELASQSEDNPIVYDYLEQAVRECHSSLYRRAVGLFVKPDPQKICENIYRKIKLGVSKDIQRHGGGLS
jgi:hypothetical protein